MPAKRVEIVKVCLVRESSFPYAERKIRGPFDAYALLKNFIEDMDRECFIMACLNTKHEPTAIHVISIGSLNATIVHPREVFKAAILSNSSAIILAHNHPSGDPEPSREDREVFEKLKKAGEILRIEVLDYIIVGYGRYASLVEREGGIHVDG